MFSLRVTRRGTLALGILEIWRYGSAVVPTIFLNHRTHLLGGRLCLLFQLIHSSIEKSALPTFANQRSHLLKDRLCRLCQTIFILVEMSVLPTFSNQCYFLGSPWKALRPILEPSWGDLEETWGDLEGLLGSSLRPLEASWELLGVVLRSSW